MGVTGLIGGALAGAELGSAAAPLTFGLSIVAGAVVGVVVAELVSGPLHDILAPYSASDAAPVRLLITNYVSGGITREQLLASTTFKSLKAQDQELLLQAADETIAKKHAAVNAALVKTMLTSSNTLFNKIETINSQYANSIITSFEGEITALQVAISDLADSEFKASQGDELLTVNAVIKSLEGLLGSTAKTSDTLIAAIPFISYPDFYTTAYDVMVAFLSDQASTGVLPDSDTVSAYVQSALVSQGLITNSEMNYALQNGYVDSFNSTIPGILSQIKSTPNS